MTYATNHSLPASCVSGKAIGGSKAAANKAGILRRIIDAIFESPERQAEREISRFVARSDGHFTDDIEREMTQRILTGHWSARR